MADSQESVFDLGEWTVSLTGIEAALECRHRSSRCRLKGRLSFWARVGKKEVRWAIGPSLDAGLDRLTLLNEHGDCQGYLVFEGDTDVLRMRVIQRGMQKFRGTLRLQAAASVGRHTFACRTAAQRSASRVAQMASGPADSLLNNALFDIGRDVALVFTGAHASIRTRPSDGRRTPLFNVRIDAEVDDAADSAISIEVERDYYRKRYVPWYRPVDKARCPSPPTGWMSWNVYFDTAGERENLDEARVAAKRLKPYGLEIWSIESWQDNSATLPVRNFHNLTLRPYAKQFPHGMKWLAGQIRKLGFRPGIWTVPFGTGDEEFCQAHKDWFLHHRDGTPMSNWCGRFVLDPSQPRVRKHMEDTHRKMAREWGYEFFKIDGMSGKSSSYSAHFYERPEVQMAFQRRCAEPYLRCVHALRKGIGSDRILLACQGHYTGPEAAVADASRIGADIVSPNHPPRWHNYLDQAQTTLAQLFVHNIVWYSDPDTLLVSKSTSTSVARIAATVVGLPGQMMFAGDKLAQLPSERMWLLQRCLPVCDVWPLDLYPIYELKPVWTLKVARPFATWDVVSLFNWDETRAKRVGFRVAELGLDPDVEYLAYEFWARKFAGVVKRKFDMKLPARSSALLALHPSLGRPQFLSTDRHITQGAVSLEALTWDADGKTLSGSTQLVANETTTLTFHVPKGFSLDRASARGAVLASAKQRRDCTATLVLRSNRATTVKWTVEFQSEAR